MRSVLALWLLIALCASVNAAARALAAQAICGTKAASQIKEY
jgi:hypothetical protein